MLQSEMMSCSDLRSLQPKFSSAEGISRLVLLQCLAICCIVLHCFAVWCSVKRGAATFRAECAGGLVCA